METMIGFPGLGIKDFHVNPIAFDGAEIGMPWLKIAWYGVIIAFGMILAYLYALRNMRIEGIKDDHFLDIIIFTVPMGIISARIFYVLFSLNDYHSFYEMIAIWNGGISILGAVIGGALTIVAVTKFKRISTFKALDAIAPAVMIGQILGRWGNFMNAEVYGNETTLPWRMRITSAQGTIEVHPLFLYESLWNLAGLIIIHLIYKKKTFDGQIFLCYVFWYGLIRSLLELMRNDEFILKTSGGLPASFIVSVAACVTALIVLITKTILTKNKKEKKI
ncbi:MAG: prolipoprotein diacylglyceryl transferase [Ruminococcaceae bacterium]|nr:prolipoprotein diacylglyceryl transferase [Oscillospiraceae bacterium]